MHLHLLAKWQAKIRPALALACTFFDSAAAGEQARGLPDWLRPSSSASPEWLAAQVELLSAVRGNVTRDYEPAATSEEQDDCCVWSSFAAALSFAPGETFAWTTRLLTAGHVPCAQRVRHTVDLLQRIAKQPRSTADPPTSASRVAHYLTFDHLEALFSTPIFETPTPRV